MVLEYMPTVDRLAFGAMSEESRSLKELIAHLMQRSPYIRLNYIENLEENLIDIFDVLERFFSEFGSHIIKID
jgi:hypothetical protein